MTADVSIRGGEVTAGVSHVPLTKGGQSLTEVHRTFVAESVRHVLALYVLNVAASHVVCENISRRSEKRRLFVTVFFYLALFKLQAGSWVIWEGVNIIIICLDYVPLVWTCTKDAVVMRIPRFLYNTKVKAKILAKKGRSPAPFDLLPKTPMLDCATVPPLNLSTQRLWHAPRFCYTASNSSKPCHDHVSQDSLILVHRLLCLVSSTAPIMRPEKRGHLPPANPCPHLHHSRPPPSKP